MKIPGITSKEQLVLNELIHKYKLSDQFSRKDILALHEELIGNLKRTWLQKHFKKDTWEADRILEIYSMLIYPLAYPSMKLKNEGFGKMSSFFWENRIRPNIKSITKCSFSVGRIITQNKKGKLMSISSGFMIGNSWLITIANQFNEIKDIVAANIKNRYWVDFSESKKIPDQEELFEIEDFVCSINNPKESLIILSLRNQTNSGLKLPPPLQINRENKKSEVVVTIGYPLKMPKQFNRLLSQYAVFGSPWQMGNKRIAPGHLEENEFGLYHDCSVSIGSEGSPIINSKTGIVIGVHLGRSGKNRSNMQKIDVNYLSKNFKIVI